MLNRVGPGGVGKTANTVEREHARAQGYGVADTRVGLPGRPGPYDLRGPGEIESRVRIGNMSTTALLVIDIQQAAFNGAFVQPIDRAADLVANARTLIDAAHAAGQPVISDRVNGELQLLGAVLEPTARIASGFGTAD